MDSYLFTKSYIAAHKPQVSLHTEWIPWSLLGQLNIKCNQGERMLIPLIINFVQWLLQMTTIVLRVLSYVAMRNANKRGPYAVTKVLVYSYNVTLLWQYTSIQKSPTVRNSPTHW